MNDVKFLEQSMDSEIPIGTMVHLEEDISIGARVYMLVKKEPNLGILVNLSDGRAWSWVGLALHDDMVSYASLKVYCNVPFTFVHAVYIATKEGK